MKKTLTLSAAAAALMMAGGNAAWADHCNAGHVHAAIDPLVTTSISSEDFVNQGFSNQPQHSPNGQGTSGRTETTTTTTTQNRVACANTGVSANIQPNTDQNVGDPTVTTDTEITDEFSPRDNAPGQQ